MLNANPEFRENAIAVLKRRFIEALIIMTMLVSVGGLIAQVVAGLTNETGIFTPGVASVTVLIVICGWLYWQVQQRRIQLASNIFIIAIILNFWGIPILTISLLLGVIGIIAGAILATNIMYAITNVVIFAKYFFLLANIVSETGFEVTDEGSAITLYISVLVVISVSTRYFISNAEKSAESFQRSTDLLQAAQEIGQITSKLTVLGDLFDRAVELIRDRFGYYHVQVFLIDDQREYANLVASTGSAGRELLRRKHRLPVGSRSVIGRVTQTAEIVIARDRDVQGNTIHARNELLPNTRSELALPIMDGDTIIGALDVQSSRADAFNPVEVQTLQLMANQLAVAYRNTQLFEDQERSVQENKRLFFESEANLREIKRLNQQLTREAWETYLGREQEFEGVSMTNDGIAPQQHWTPIMVEAAESLQAVVRMVDNDLRIAVPITLRNQVLGVIEVSPGEGTVRSSDIVEMVQTIATRLAITLDNARLFEESQMSAQQEQRLNNIVGEYQSAQTVDDLLRLTLEELGATLGATHGAIRLGTGTDSQPARPGSNGDSANGHSSNGHSSNGHHNGGTAS